MTLLLLPTTPHILINNNHSSSNSNSISISSSTSSISTRSNIRFTHRRRISYHTTLPLLLLLLRRRHHSRINSSTITPAFPSARNRGCMNLRHRRTATNGWVRLDSIVARPLINRLRISTSDMVSSLFHVPVHPAQIHPMLGWRAWRLLH